MNPGVVAPGLDRRRLVRRRRHDRRRAAVGLQVLDPAVGADGESRRPAASHLGEALRRERRDPCIEPVRRQIEASRKHGAASGRRVGPSQPLQARRETRRGRAALGAPGSGGASRNSRTVRVPVTAATRCVALPSPSVGVGAGDRHQVDELVVAQQRRGDGPPPRHASGPRPAPARAAARGVAAPAEVGLATRRTGLRQLVEAATRAAAWM